jgi:hypothetical protein
MLNLGNNSAFIVSVFLSFDFTSSRRGPPHIFGFIPRILQPLIPLIPLPIAIILIAARERRISAVKAARSQIEELRVTVASSQPVLISKINCLAGKKGGVVDWGLIEKYCQLGERERLPDPGID